MSGRHLPRTVTLIAASVAVIVTVLLPLVHFLQGRTLIQHEIELKASVKAELIGKLAAVAPDTWRYQDTRLVDMLERGPAEIGGDYARVLTLEGRQIIGAGKPAAEPALQSAAEVIDSGVAVAQIEVARSLEPLIVETAMLAMLAAALGAVVFLTLRVLPLRALRDAMQSITAHLRYQEKIAQLGQAALVTGTSPELTGIATRHALDGLAAEAVVYVERLSAEGSLVVRAAAGSAPACEAEGSEFPLTDGLARLFDAGEAMPFAEGAGLPFAWARAMRAGVLAPVRDGSAVRGILYAFSARQKPFSAEEQKFLDACATALSSALRRIAIEERLSFLAQFDALTGLPNRAMLEDRFAQAIAQARRHRACLGVLFIDLDEFKAVNDTLGHAAGDELLRQAAARLQQAVRHGDTVARISGDEFAIVCSELARPEDAALVAQNVIERLAAPVMAHGREVRVTASVGIAIFPADGNDPGSLMHAADAAMYRAKHSGRNAYQFFTADITHKTQARAHLVSDLRRALEQDEFVLAYQPRIDVRSGLPCGAEALLRWQPSGGQGTLAPQDFVPALEETGLIVEVGEWVLRRACRDIKAWIAAGVPPLPLAVNLSGRQLRQQDLDARICGVIGAERVDPRLIELEITETQLMQDPEQAKRVMSSLRDAGFRFIIDDFGTGYSSLAYLTRFPIAALKIDRSCVRNLPASETMVRIIIETAHMLGLRVIAEGVETQLQARYMAEQGCEEAQGYFYGRPMPFGDLTALTSGKAYADV